MAQAIPDPQEAANLFGPPPPEERFAGLDAGPGQPALEAIAAAISAARRPAASADIPSGAVYFAQFAVHDLDFRGRAGEAHRGRFDLGLIYGDGPRHDAFCYRLPDRPGERRYLLRVGHTRTARGTPAWSVARDLPRAACPHLDPRGREAMTDVLVPNAFSDSNAILAQMQTLWALLHNAVAGRLVDEAGPAEAFTLARAITRDIYRAAIRRDLLDTWLHPRFRARYAGAVPKPLDGAVRAGLPVEFMAGVGRLGHGMVREVYDLNGSRPITGLRDMLRHTGTARPHEMPLTEDWLIDFSRFFAIGASVPQRAGAIGPHVPRAFATETGFGAGVSFPAEGLVLRDLIASAHSGVRSVRSLIARAAERDARVLDGCFAQDETAWRRRMTDWLTGAGLGAQEVARLAADPPLVLFLMIEAEAETDGRSLGALGSIIMGETFAAGLAAPFAGIDDRAVAAARERVFDGRVPAGMARMIEFLQRHHRFTDAARLHAPLDGAEAETSGPATEGDATVHDTIFATKEPVPRTRVIDHFEMGKLVVQWTLDPGSRPHNIEELRDQLEGVAHVPPTVKTFSFCENTLSHLAIRLPAPDMVRESVDRLSDPSGPLEYPIPQFYADHFHPGLAPVLTPLDMLYARIGDYTIAQCR